MISRCYNNKNKSYADYGGRGITVCDRWRNSFPDFIKDMGKKPTGLSIDRIENNGNYEPGNCRWANSFNQANNTRKNVYLTYKGETRTVNQWARHLNLANSTLRNRLDKLNWPIDKAFNVNPDYGNRKYIRSDKITHNGQCHTLVKWAKVTGIKIQTLRKRIKLNWSIEKALTTPVRKQK